MQDVSRALANDHLDRAFALLTHVLGCRGHIAAAFLLESGADVDGLPRDAKRAIVEYRGLAA